MPRRAAPTLEVDPDVEVVVHVARHLAGKGQLTTRHLLVGLLQNESFAAAIARVGGDADAISSELPQTADEQATWRLESEEETELRSRFRKNGGGDAALALLGAITIAKRNGRLASCADLWAYLSRTDAGVDIERAGVDPVAVLFVLTHGIPEQDMSGQSARVVHVVLRNDPYTRTPLVVEVLREVFELGEPAALEVIHATEQSGRAVVGRFETARARELVLAGRARARVKGSPLWLGLEDC